ncbi:putative serine/threonine protein phosphatase [Leptomonas pyrrhocoris]|uniref:Serine/threonine-protein phosphatase n=1 Tax=Leptomonas pyrrhocoris TaxID=157538 RepID=A0A0M9FWR5_LEPPY|nr:putative serine/threonine protein phosphatase [Leptomonas pyrrhocoris]KPA77537.1 putative serine/threonine protein phosphatase [Leptomonas pyrrhocoris]|eukprot:XP_015655976.1 putative serine/threonine protein phosphatase [Leptomonas pyrrhocoris]
MPSDLASLSREELVNRVLDLQAENSALSRQLRSTASSKRGSGPSPTATCMNAHYHNSNNISGDVSGSGGDGATSPIAGSGSHSDPVNPFLTSPHASRLGGSMSISSDVPASPAAARLSGRPSMIVPPAPSYEISMSVMVIENGAALSVPLAAVLNKTYGREDVREADTPVVSSKFLRDMDSLRTQRFSVGDGHGDEVSPSMNLDEEFTENFSASRPSADDAGDRSRASILIRASGGGGGGGGATGNAMIAGGGGGGDDDDGEPAPTDPRADSVRNAAAASSLAQRAGVTNLHLRQDLLFARDMSLDVDAIITHQTLRLFNQQFGRDGNMLSPMSSYGNAIYHYIVKTFAVRNGCEHSPDDVEGFGRTLINLCREVKHILQDEPRHGSSVSPCYVFGDLHGNFRDLFYFMDNLISFQDLRYTPHRFVFLGDYVDRGEFSVEVVAYLFSMKVLAPQKVLLLRGNHEDTLVSGDVSGYGNTSFRAQCHSTFGTGLGEELWHRASETFSYLPLSANIDGKIYCTHGGVPRYGGGVDDRLDVLKSPDFPIMESFFQVPEEETPQHKMYRQIGMDSCWADPAENESKLDKYGFGANPRGTGVILFGTKAVDDFLDHFHFEYIFRAHQEKSDGLKLSKSARVFTIFSTSAYVGHQNGAGVVLVAEGKIRLIVKNADTYEEDDYMAEEDDGYRR